MIKLIPGIRLRRYIFSSRFGASPDTIYKDELYISGGFQNTGYDAKKITSSLSRHYAPDSVIDLGCGTRNDLVHFGSLGRCTLRIEGSKTVVCQIPKTLLALQYYFRRTLHLNRRCDHAIKTIFFTAAPPKTRGDDHFNRRSRSFWDQMFNQHDSYYDETETNRLRDYSIGQGVNEWFQEWSFVFHRTMQPNT